MWNLNWLFLPNSSFDGELTSLQIKNMELSLPSTIKNVILKLDTSEKLPQGTGCYIKFNTNKIFYDKEHKILQIRSIIPAACYLQR